MLPNSLTMTICMGAFLAKIGCTMHRSAGKSTDTGSPGPGEWSMAPTLDAYAGVTERRFGGKRESEQSGTGGRSRPTVSLVTVCLHARPTPHTTIPHTPKSAV